MNQNVRQLQRRLKQIVAGVIFVGLLVGASGTVFTAFAAAISQLGQPTTQSSTLVQGSGGVTISPSTTDSPRASVGSSGNSGTSNPLPGVSNPSNQYLPPVMEYSNTQPSQGSETSSATSTSINNNAAVLANDGVHSALADAMDKSGVYVGERVQKAFGSMLKGVLNTLFINTN